MEISNTYTGFSFQNSDNSKIKKTTSPINNNTPAKSEVSTVAEITEKLQKQFGFKINIGNYENVNEVIQTGATGKGNIAIAPNILKSMAEKTTTLDNYCKKIQNYFNGIPYGDKFMAARGREVTASGIIIHENGKVTTWSCSDYSEKEKRRLKAAIKEETEEKQQKWEEYLQTLSADSQKSAANPNKQTIISSAYYKLDINV